MRGHGNAQFGFFELSSTAQIFSSIPRAVPLRVTYVKSALLTKASASIKSSTPAMLKVRLSVPGALPGTGERPGGGFIMPQPQQSRWIAIKKSACARNKGHPLQTEMCPQSPGFEQIGCMLAPNVGGVYRTGQSSIFLLDAELRSHTVLIIPVR